MKAIVVEVNDDFAALMREDGSVVKIDNEYLKVGDMVRIRQIEPLFKGKYIFAVAAVALLIVLVAAGTYVL